jgi:hypothetical protein
MSLEETILGGVVAGATKKILDAATPKKGKARLLRDRLDVLEAERLVLTIEVRNALLREAKKLLPAAIKQARGDGKKPGSPALLRLISRMVIRNVNIEPRK